MFPKVKPIAVVSQEQYAISVSEQCAQYTTAHTYFALSQSQPLIILSSGRLNFGLLTYAWQAIPLLFPNMQMLRQPLQCRSLYLTTFGQYFRSTQFVCGDSGRCICDIHDNYNHYINYKNSSTTIVTPTSGMFSGIFRKRSIRSTAFRRPTPTADKVCPVCF